MISADYVNIGCLIVMCGVAFAGILHRVKTKKGIGIRFIQFLGVCMGIPAFIMLAFAGKIETQTVGSIIGAVVGLSIAKVGKDEE